MGIEEQVRDLQVTTMALQLIVTAAFHTTQPDIRKLLRMRVSQLRTLYETSLPPGVRDAVAERVRLLLAEPQSPAPPPQ